MCRISLILIAMTIIGCQSDNDAGAKHGSSSAQPRFDPMVAALIQDSVAEDDSEQSKFWGALSSLAQQRNWPDTICWQRQGRAVLIPGDEPSVVVVLYMTDSRFPGEDVQNLLLLDSHGTLQDTLSCSINNRVVFWGNGIFRTDVPLDTQLDGAQLIIRYVPNDGGSISGNFAHEIHQDGKAYSFHWDDDRPQSETGNPWQDKGLCRVAIQDRKFKVLFPTLKGQLITNSK